MEKKLYLIGGSGTRVGRSLTRKLLIQGGGITNALDTDTIRHAFRYDPMNMSTDEQSHIRDVAKLILGSWTKYRSGSVLEGAIITPPRIAQLCAEYPQWIDIMRVVFLGNAEIGIDEKAEIISDSKRYPGETSWTDGRSDILWIASESIRLSQITRDEVSVLKQQLPALETIYVDTSTRFDNRVQNAAMFLATGVVPKG